MPDEEKKGLIDKLKREIARLEWEEELLHKRDDRLKWEEEMLQMEEGLKVKGKYLIDNTPSEMLGGGPQSEPKEKPPPPPAAAADDNVVLDAGSTYLLLEQKPERSIRLFIREMKGGMKGLYITRANPNQVKKTYDLGDAKVCWLTGVRASGDIVSVSGLQELSILISNFIDEDNRGVILLDGLEYLISNNDFSIVLRLLQQIRDKVSTSESKMMIPVNSNALEGRQLTLLERECHTLK